MKLRTIFQDEDFEYGEIVEAEFISSNDILLRAKTEKGGVHIFRYRTLSDFCSDWEDGNDD